jgi:ABC-type multidrug transport system ATPase subunit/pSer/pThr/pTyr-binding forkhead associated (FHA) protein
MYAMIISLMWKIYAIIVAVYCKRLLWTKVWSDFNFVEVRCSLEAEQKVVSGVAIRFLSGPLADRTITIQKPVTEIGRDGQNDVVVPDQRVSRRHARILWQNGSWTIENLSQSSFVAVNQQRVQQGALQYDSVVSLGENTSFMFLVQSHGSQFPPLLPGTQPALPYFQTPQFPFKPPEAPVPERRLPGNVPSNASPSGTILAPVSEIGVPSLTVSSNIHSEQQVHTLNKQTLSIGRDPENDMVIGEPMVSAWHAQIVREGNELFIVHPHPLRGKTLNGLWYQGQHILGDQQFRKKLVNGDIFRIGDEYGTLVTLTYDSGAGISSETLPEMKPIPLTVNMLTIGRTPDNTLVLNHPQVSAHHALLEKVEGGYRVVDSNSTNHVYVNGQQMTNQLLRTGDEIRIGPYRLIYTGTELTQYDESNNIRIDALHLKKVGNNNVILLDDISLIVPPRKFVALVGGSGAGKSTLMDALNGLRPAQGGTVLYNGEDYYRNLAAFSTQLGYVPQDDIVHRELTVERALYYAARLRLPRDFTREQIQWRIDEVLEDVEMTERRSLMVSKLSGGQRKRVSIALELLANPSVFFLDEPTSGLDPGLDRKMMSLLRHLADRGRTIILVTHATNNINACDYVCFLAQGGRLAYFGPPNEAKVYFEKTDFAEIYGALEPTKEHPDIPKQAEERFLASQDYQQYVAQPLREDLNQQELAQERKKAQPVEEKTPKRVKRGNAWSQFILLSRRYLELLKNDKGNLLILLLQAPVIGIILVLMVRFEVGAGVFDSSKLVQCRTQILTSSGPLAMPQAQQTEKIGCQQVLNFLTTDPNGQAFVQKRGGQEQALQDFILPGPGADAQKLLFIMAFATVLFGCINGAREIVKESAIYKRERTVNLGILPYMFSKIVVLGMLCLFQSAVLVLVVELGEPLQQGIFWPPVLETYITLVLTSLAGLMIGLAISAIAPNNDRAISLVPIILIPQVIFSGAIIALKDWFTQILAFVFPTRWAMAALGSSIGLHADKIGGDKLFGDDYTYHSTLFSIYTQSDAFHRLLLSWAALGAITIVLMIVIGIFLKRKDVRV